MSAPGTLKAAKAALVDTLRALPEWAEVAVFYGPCGIDEPDDYCEIRDATFTEADALQSPQRRRWYDFEIDGWLSCFFGGDDQVQQDATERALDLLSALADYLQDAGTVGSQQTSLGGVVQWARLDSAAVSEEDEDIARGRTTTVEFTVTGRFQA